MIFYDLDNLSDEYLGPYHLLSPVLGKQVVLSVFY